jgi:hypothetical protein
MSLLVAVSAKLESSPQLDRISNGTVPQIIPNHRTVEMTESDDIHGVGFEIQIPRRIRYPPTRYRTLTLDSTLLHSSSDSEQHS